MRPLLYVVDHVGAEHPLEVAPAVDQHVVEALGTDCPHEPLREGVGAREPEPGDTEISWRSTRRSRRRAGTRLLFETHQRFSSMASR